MGESNEKNICNPEAKKWNKEMMSICRVILATVMNLQPKGIMLWIAWPCLLSTPWNLHLNLNNCNLCLIFALFRSFASLWTFYCGLGLLIFHTMIRYSFKIACASTICSVKTNKFSHAIYQNPNRSDKMVTSGAPWLLGALYSCEPRLCRLVFIKQLLNGVQLN